MTDFRSIVTNRPKTATTYSLDDLDRLLHTPLEHKPVSQKRMIISETKAHASLENRWPLWLEADGRLLSDRQTKTAVECGKPKGKSMKNRFVWASALTLAVITTSQTQTLGQGVIYITTRAPQDTAASGEFINDEKGPGQCSPGDVGMGQVLGDYGYTSRLLLDKVLADLGGAWCSAPPASSLFLTPLNANFSPALIIYSGSSSSGDVGARNTSGIPVMIGEHAVLAERAGKPGDVHMYAHGDASTDPNQGTPASKYMVVVNTSHPIMQGIPLDALNRVKIWRDSYPEENAHVPTGGFANYEYRWCAIAASNAAPGTVVLGELEGTYFDGSGSSSTPPGPFLQDHFSVFAVNDAGGLLADATLNPARLVHIFSNETGSNDPRRVFNNLTDLGRVLFVRAAKWAMGETLTPYVPTGLIQTTMVSPNKLQLQWAGSAMKNYKVLATANLLGASDFSNWQTVVQDIPGIDPGVGPTSVKLDISNGPQYAFLRVVPMP